MSLQEKKEKTLQPLDPTLKYEPSLQPLEAKIATSPNPVPVPENLRAPLPAPGDMFVTVNWLKVALIGACMPFRAFLFYIIVGGIAAGLFAAALPLLILLLIVGLGLVIAALPALVILSAVYFSAQKLDEIFIPESMVLSSCAAVFTFATIFWLTNGIHFWGKAHASDAWRSAVAVALPFALPMLSLLFFTFLLTERRFYRIPETARCAIIMVLAALPALFGVLKI